MKTIIGLGNPGEKYQNTRHNVGSMVVEEIAKRILGQDTTPKFEALKKAHVEIFKTSDVILARSSDYYMNESGKAVVALLNYFNIGPQSLRKEDSKWTNLVIIHDDLDIVLGSYKIQFGKGPRDHNGLLSIYQHLKTNQFWHVRVGIENRAVQHQISGEVYVLQSFQADELVILKSVINQLVTEIDKLGIKLVS